MADADKKDDDEDEDEEEGEDKEAAEKEDKVEGEEEEASKYETFWKAFVKYIKMVDPLFSAVDAKESVFAAWEDEYHNSCAGMRHRKTGASHGVIRAVKPNDWVVEGTYKDGKAHGLVRSLNSSKVVLTLHSEGSQLARIEFDSKLQETYRLDPQQLLTELDADSLKFT